MSDHRVAAQNYINGRIVKGEDGCWIWQGRPNRNGFGKYNREGKLILAHVGSWEAWRSKVPSLVRVKHSCKNRLCVNPDHLTLAPIKTHHVNSMEFIKSNSKIDAVTGCWNWLDRINHNGYGVVAVGSRSVLMHRAAWELTNGSIPPGYQVCHKCDNRKCVNPAHLFAGTANDNQQDKVQKNRQMKGQDCWKAKLNPDAVRAIRNSSAPRRELAKVFNVCYAVITNVKSGRSWRHVV